MVNREDVAPLVAEIVVDRNQILLCKKLNLHDFIALQEHVR